MYDDGRMVLRCLSWSLGQGRKPAQEHGCLSSLVPFYDVTTTQSCLDGSGSTTNHNERFTHTVIGYCFVIQHFSKSAVSPGQCICALQGGPELTFLSFELLIIVSLMS